MKNTFLITLLLFIHHWSAAQCNFGASFEITNAISLEQMYNEMENADSIDVQIQAIVTTTCKKAGCWMEVESPDGKFKTKVFMKDHAFGVPLEGCEGKKTVINGRVFRYKLSVEYLRHLAEDAGKSKEEIEKIDSPEEAIAIDAFGVWMAVTCPKEK
jgi:Domain of unknown function (DUF4920)